MAQFDKDLVLAVLGEIGRLCNRKMTIYLLGGGAMALRGEKDATKDVDLVLESQEDAKELVRSLRQIGFEITFRPPLECRALKDATILVESEGMRIDVFVGTICNKLVFSHGMRTRSTSYGELGDISLKLVSREDIFLLKSVTERSRDLEDMLTLYRKGLRKEVILSECDYQGALEDLEDGRIWDSFLLMKLVEMEDRFVIQVPWKRELIRRAELRTAASLALKRLRQGPLDEEDLRLFLKLDKGFFARVLAFLREKGLVTYEPDTKVVMKTG